jgi:MFS family permease
MSMGEGVLCVKINVSQPHRYLFGFGFISEQPAAMALLLDRIRPEKRGLTISTFFKGFDVGISVGHAAGCVGHGGGTESDASFVSKS